jgi:hypothetical protein
VPEETEGIEGSGKGFEEAYMTHPDLPLGVELVKFGYPAASGSYFTELFLYVLGSEDGKIMKIGCTTNPAKRHKTANKDAKKNVWP